ncbi:MAG: V-type ATPase 116kDa subunit family protein [Armatimonadota bacterium]|nr:V-type ATPase 116kDa subunit family protein [Armatimonadota bacterium]MDR7451482.1 V-type ATPase 116kDa subunit family protein [Armatimonadota bacterium]MDR7467449.1 V-type ATPase 116kDa subunit family protein [Armatimonadota bacterium]MDR7494323.1 V-type ATPase 116kDa subunit family protein [Armatimonadota bacterium]MDR7499140.1 V-type ATPase 116kDa subunit family protein [Armatimonadota bacterium]
MIVEMSRIVVLGPKRLLGPVIEEVQNLGALHIDHIESEEAPVQPLQLTEEERQRMQRLERAVTRADGLLTLLPAPAAGGAAADGGAANPVEVAGLSTEDLDARLAGIEQHVRDLTRARLELEEELSLIASYEGAVRALSPLLNALAGSRTLESLGFLLNTRDLTVATAIRNELIKATEGRVEVVSRVVDENRIGVVAAFRKQDADLIRPVLSRAGVSELRLPARFAGAPASEALTLMERRKAEAPQEIARIDREIAGLARVHRAWVAGARAVLADRLGQMKVVPELAQSRYTFILHGWAPTRKVAEIRGRLRQRFGSDLAVYDQPADPHDAPERVPVMLDNVGFVRPFQRLLSLFLPPRYGAWDPSPVMAITFPIFVGLVIGDVGYGLLFFLLGWAFRNRARAGQALEIRFLSLRFPPPLLADISFLIRVAALWTVAFGVIYAECFGNLPETLFHLEPLFNRVHETNRYFLFIIAAGVLMIFFGLIVHLVQALRHRHLVGVFEAAVIMLGTAGLLLFLGARGGTLPASLGSIGLYVFAAAIGVALLSLLVERDPIKRFLWLLESTSAFGHILSHARLMAFGLAAAALANAANQLGAQAGSVGVVMSVFVGALFQALFFVFTIIGHVIQPARLHWVEFFSKFKFHEETGRRYRPFQKSSEA